MATIEVTLVNDSEGNIDVGRSLTAAEEAIRRTKASRETEKDTIAQALTQVFDARPGVKMNMPFVINQALSLMGVSEQPGSYKVLYDRVHAYITDNSQGKTLDKVAGVVERPDSLFVIGKGKGGGCARRADLDAAAAAQVAQS